MSNADEYKAEFNKLEQLLKKRADKYSEDSLSSVVSYLVRTRHDRIVRQFERDIRQFIELRNAIIHQSTGRAIAEPYEETVSSLKKLIANIEHPRTSWDIATKKLLTIGPDDRLSSVISIMSQNGVTSLPIVEDREVIGFVSEGTIVRMLDRSFEEGGGALVEEALVKDIDYDQPYGNESDLYKYVGRYATVYDIEDAFNAAISDGKRLLAVIVSDTGDNNSTPIGIITAWDLHKIDN